ncbi:substrate-binding domain-containing protein [Marseilla massiliensis]|uniref:histidine kinase n=1 Tax=Marseilla massiliensis TaxID=1841864 RepID=A0A938WRM9_9BACT|nr:substrate-binding domain-containing protein [Marseilla massiliensis]MBM6672953.1 substrate-binding domain-containing protein [Marseilla massiliensis]
MDLIRKSNLLVCLSLVCLSTCFLACTSGKKTYVIGVSQCSEDSWRMKLNDELRDATYLHDNVELHVVSADDNDKHQIRQINAFMKEDVDLLIVSPNQMNTVTPAIDRAYDSGIPVVLFDRKTDSGKYTAFVGADNEKIGRTIGEYIATRLGGKGTVVEIRGLEGSSPAIERHKGFVSAIRKYPGIRLLASESGTWLQQSGDSVAAKMFARGIVPDYVFGQNDRMAHGAWLAARRCGLEGRIRFVGIDALPGEGGGIELVRDGVLDASYIYPTRGDIVMQQALSILEGRPYERDLYMKAALVTKDNAETMLMQAEEMSHISDQLEKLHRRVDFFFTQYSHQKVYFLLCAIILLLVIVAFAAFNRMVMVRRRMERETAEAKMAFFTDMSHDLRTPLTLIADPVERILDDENLTGRQRHMLGIVRRNAALLLKLVGEILDLRKIQGGKMDLTVTEFNLADAVRLWVDDFKPLAASYEVTIVQKADGDLTVKADYYKVERICYNLISNSLKYNRKGGTVTVEAVRRGGSVEITVADTGVGIPKDVVSRVFDKFYRVRGGGSGTGVGLAVVKAFAELHGGRVSVKSVEGEGSEFKVELPQKVENAILSTPDTLSKHPEGREPDMQKQRKAWIEDVDDDIDGNRQGMSSSLTSGGLGYVAEPDGTSASRPLALVVDDNADVREYVAHLLGGEYDVRQAADGKEGLGMALKTVPDLIVCDVKMPVMDGLEMCRRVKAETATSHVPVILLTSNAQENQRAEGYDSGADAYITKPFSSKVLLSRVRNLLENRKRLKYVYASGADDEARDEADPDSRFMADFGRVVRERMSDSSLSVETISSVLGLSRVQMYRKVKQLTGQSPVEIIRVTRLKKAERLLKTTQMTVSEISYDVGFSSPSYFSKCFKDYFGVQPGEMRETY